MQLPAETAAIFTWLCQGRFICADHPDPAHKRWFRLLHDFEKEYTDYFLPLGFRLEKRAQYFFFSQTESQASQNEKREKVMRYLDWLEIGLGLDTYFGPGCRIMLESWSSNLSHDSSSLRKLRKLGMRGNPRAPDELLRSWLREMERAGFVAQTHTSPEQFRVLASMDYLIRFFQNIQINDSAGQ